MIDAVLIEEDDGCSVDLEDDECSNTNTTDAKQSLIESEIMCLTNITCIEAVFILSGSLRGVRQCYYLVVSCAHVRMEQSIPCACNTHHKYKYCTCIVEAISDILQHV